MLNMLLAVVVPVTLAILVALHRMTLGRSSPIAAGAFFVFGPILWIGIGLYQAAKPGSLFESAKYGGGTAIDEYFLPLGFKLALITGLAAATIVGGVATMICDEWIDDDWRDRD